MKYSVLSLLAVTLAASCSDQPRKVWEVEKQDLETQRTTRLGVVVGGPGLYGSDAWLGIPFAEPPIGDLRWRTPKPAKPWTEARSTLKFGPGCEQLSSPLGIREEGVPLGALVGSEDCLYLNVWAPHLPAKELNAKSPRWPVVVWVHGGGNTIGTATTYDGGHLSAAQKIIVVTTQYRLGPLGWFKYPGLYKTQSDAVEASGNFGTMDLVQSLKWVRENIEAFGGDPNDITLMGQSAGARDVFSLLVTPEAKGLFHRAIVESSWPSFTTVTDAEAYADEVPAGNQNSSSEVVLRMLSEEYPGMSRVAMKEKIAAMDPQDLAKKLRQQSVAKLFASYTGEIRLGMIKMPLLIQDGYVLPKDEWTKSLANPTTWNQVPVLIGTTRNEIKLFMFFDQRFVHRWLGKIPRFNDQDSYEGIAEPFNRMWKIKSADLPAQAMRQSGEKDVYGYLFDWHQEPMLFGSDLSKMLGAAHGFEIPFVFGHFDFGETGKRIFGEGDADRDELSNAMMSYWGQFIRAGRPGQGVEGKLPQWQPWSLEPQGPKYMVLDLEKNGTRKMSSELDSPDTVLAAIEQDSRLPTQELKCKVFEGMAGFLHLINKEQYKQVASNRCAINPW